MPQLIRAAIHHDLSFKSLRWAYHAKVMKTLEIRSREVVAASGGMEAEGLRLRERALMQ